MVRYKEYTYPDLASARDKAKEMKKHYGYTPGVYKLTKPGHTPFYSVVKPKGLKKVSKKKQISVFFNPLAKYKKGEY